MFRKILKPFKFLKLVNILRKWNKYNPNEYDEVIEKAFTIIDWFELGNGEMSPSFTLLDSQLNEEFMIKFLEKAKENYKLTSKKEDESSTTFNLIGK